MHPVAEAPINAVILLKPDVFERRLWGDALSWLARATDVKIIGMEMHCPTASDGKLILHYAEHTQKDFWPRLFGFMKSGPTCAIAVETADIAKVRDAVMFYRQKREAAAERNLLHCSDSEISGTRELQIWFPST